MNATQPIASLRFFRLESGETIAATHVLLQESDTVARFSGLVVDMPPGVLAYEVTLQVPPRQDESSEVELLRAALVEERAERLAKYDIAQIPQHVDDSYRADARAELVSEGLLPSE